MSITSAKDNMIKKNLTLSTSTSALDNEKVLSFHIYFPRSCTTSSAHYGLGL